MPRIKCWLWRLCMFAMQVTCCADVVADTNMVAAEDRWQSPAFIAQAFEAVALHDEFKPGERPIRKWQTPLKLWIDDKTNNQAQHRFLTETHLKHLGTITEHSIVWAESAQ